MTGGARRIGSAIARALAQRGYDIALHYGSSLRGARRLRGAIERDGRRCGLFPTDLSQEREVLGLIDTVWDVFPDCNLLVNNASIFEAAPLLQTEPDLFDRHFNINLKAPLFLSRDFARRCRTGQIINILDTRVAHLDGSHVVYSLSKKALLEFTKFAAKELGPRIRVNGICPGLILAPAGEGPAHMKRKSERTPLKRKGDLGSLISALLFLLDNRFITGDCIFVDGGEHLMGDSA